MRWVYILPTFFVLISAASAQQLTEAARQAQAKPGDRCTLEGAVVKSTTGEPARKIQVTAQRIGGDGQPEVTESDVNGRFSFINLEPGRYTLWAGGNGYPGQAYGQRSPMAQGKLLLLEPGQHMRDIVFRIEPGGVLTGTVYDEDGDPVVLAQVEAIRLRGRADAPHYSGVASGHTNDLGQYRIFGLEPGRYLIIAMAQNQSSSNRTGELAYLPTFYPGTADVGQASPIQVNPGDEISGIDIGLSQARSVHVRGRVVVDGKAVNGVFVSLMRQSGDLAGLPLPPYGSGILDNNGGFEIRSVPPGAYLLTAGWSNQNKNYSGRMPLNVASADIDDITLTLTPGVELRGSIRADAGVPLDFNRLGVWLQSADSTSWGGAAAQVKADGTLVMENVFDGNYRLHLQGFPEEFYLKSARLGGADVLIPGLSISQGFSPGTLELHLALDGGRIDGTVLQNQNPASGALVAFVPDPPNRERDELYSSKLTDQFGRFSMGGLPPGDFKLFAWEQGQGIDFKDPEFLKDYENRGTHVHIEPHQEQAVQLELIPVEDEAR